MPSEGDDLLALIRNAVKENRSRIPYEQTDAITEIIGRMIVLIVTDPKFFSRLAPVQRLQLENAALRQELMRLQAFVRQMATPVRKAPAKKKAAAKKPVARSPQVKVKGSTATNRRAFKQGYRGS